MIINYVEYLRATRALRILAYILLALLVLSGIGRIAAMRFGSWQGRMQDATSSPTAHVTKTLLPDGAKQTVVDDPVRHVHVVLVDRGWRGQRVTVDEPARRVRHTHEHVTVGMMNVTEEQRNGVQHTVVDNELSPIDLKYLFVGALPLLLFLATTLGGPLGKENDGHLELAWTKPVSRLQYALSAMAVDLVALLVAAVAIIIVYCICLAMYEVPTFTSSPSTLSDALAMLLVPFGIYAAITALSSSLRRGPGAGIGIFWAATFIVPALSALPGPLLAPVAQIFRVLDYLNPMHYIFHSGVLGDAYSSLIEVAVLTIAYLAVSLFQWQRVEA